MEGGATGKSTAPQTRALYLRVWARPLAASSLSFLSVEQKKRLCFLCPAPPCDGEDEMGEKYELEFGSCTALDMNMKYQSLQDAARLSTS